MAKRKPTSRPSERLFADNQKDLFKKSYEEKPKEDKNKPVECLGMTFPNDEELGKYFLKKLREKLKDPEFHKMEGFPIGSDEDILALCDPLYYPACLVECLQLLHWGETLLSPCAMPLPSPSSLSCLPRRSDDRTGVKFEQCKRGQPYITK